ncbi:MAG: DNA topoisomerase IV subunit A [Kiritimatiellia bacterium]
MSKPTKKNSARPSNAAASRNAQNELPPVQVTQDLLFDLSAVTVPPPAQQPAAKHGKKPLPEGPAETAVSVSLVPLPPTPKAATPTAAKGDLPPDHFVRPGERGPLSRLMDGNFLQFASYTICHRAIPTVEDGLKPVQRRILHSLYEKDDGRFIKVASVVGHAMQYHPHGDVSIADAIVNLTNKRYLIEGQGNFGNIHTGDPAAASRYIECRLTDLARHELFNPKTTRYIWSYDGRNQEPLLLPCKLPLLLMLGAEGIAVGLSTSVLPHNFIELLEAQIAIIRKEPFKVLPDFQTGGQMDVSEYSDGIGRIKVRAKISPRQNNRLVITELPFGQTTESLVESIEEAIRKKKVPVRQINDFTAEKVEIELVLSPGAPQDAATKALFAFTNCEVSVTSRPVVLFGNRPRELPTSEILKANTAQLLDLLKRELEIRQGELQEEFHHKTLEQIFVEERIYKRIEECRTYELVQQAVLEGFKPFRKRLRREITAEDVEKLLQIRIRRISLYDINKNREDIENILKELAEVEANLKALRAYAIKYLKRLIKENQDKYPRLTTRATFGEIEVRELTATELTIKIDREGGYIGHDIRNAETLFQCSSLDKLVVCWDDGRYKVLPPPDKFFVDKNMIYCAIFDRDRQLTCVYTQKDHGFSYLKRFTFGGAIQNKEYRLAPENSEVQLLQEGTPETIYVKYRPAKSQRIHQQTFTPSEVGIKGVSARGIQMTSKGISKIESHKPRWWEDDVDSPRGVLL